MGKHYKNRGFKTVLSWELGKGAKKKLDKNQKGYFVQKTPPKKKACSGTVCKMAFWCFWGFPKKRPQKARNHYKNSGFVLFSVTVFKAIFGENGRGGDLVPGPGGIWSRKTPSFAQVVFPTIPLAKKPGSAGRSVWGTISPPLGDQIPFLQHIYIYIYMPES